MRIWIITMEDPLYTLVFIKEIIRGRKNDIIGVTIAKGGRLKIGKERSKTRYLLSLLLIMGLKSFLINVIKTFWFAVKKKYLSKLGLIKDPGLKAFAENAGIFVNYTENPNASDYIEFLKRKKPDIIINQSQFIIRKPLLEVPKIGILNRHNALLPLNRGRLTPFWVLFKQEKETGVSIHFVDNGIDSGPIIVQEIIPVDKHETFSSLVKKNYQVAPKAMLKALALLEQGFSDFIPNTNERASYNNIPAFKDAWEFRKRKLFGLFYE